MSKGIAIGLTNLYYAKMLTDVVGVGATYDTPVRISGAITANFSPNASNDTIFADDGPYESASTLGAMTLELNVADLAPAVRAELLGMTYGANGILISKGSDTPPNVAVGMSVLKSNGFSRLIWYLKGKFAAPDDNNQTRSDSINWNTPTITGNFLKRDYDDQWRVSVDTDDTNVNPTTIANWFLSPNVEASAPATEYTITITQTGIGATKLNNILYAAPVDFGEGEVYFIDFAETPSVFTVDAVDKTGEINNLRYASTMPNANVAVAITYT